MTRTLPAVRMGAQAALLAVFLSVPFLAFAQAPAPPPAPPPAVDQALRARVNEFFQDFVNKKYLEAMDLVAEDTKEAYLASGKVRMQSFKVDSIKFNDAFTKAVVKLTVKRIWTIQLQDNVVDTPMTTSWKIEKGKWVWFNDPTANPDITPMGRSDVSLVTRDSHGRITGLPQTINQQTVDAAARKILGQPTGLDKTEVTLPSNKPSTTKVSFHNGAPGAVQIEIAAPSVPGLSIKLDKQQVNSGEEAIVELNYDPRADAAAPPSATVLVTEEPFNKQFPLHIHFVGPPTAR
jgi:hypothetical protein